MSRRSHLESMSWLLVCSGLLLWSSGATRLDPGHESAMAHEASVQYGPSRTQYEGFGAVTSGGTGMPVYHVTNLDQSGPGSLRDAISGGNRQIVFDVAGTIDYPAPATPQNEHLYFSGANITLDGMTAPAPGITLRGRGLVLHGRNEHGRTAVHDVIIRGIRIRDILDDRSQSGDGIQLGYDTYNIVIDHVSIKGATDGSVDIGYSGNDTGGPPVTVHNVTVSWSILQLPQGEGKNSLSAFHAQSLTFHHNFLYARQRNLQVRYDDRLLPAPGTTADIRNNVVEGTISGTWIRNGATANIVNNYYIVTRPDPARLILVTAAQAHVAGNVSSNPRIDLGSAPVFQRGSVRVPTPFPAPPVTTTDARTAACQVLQNAGVQPRDDADRAAVNSVKVDGCLVSSSGSVVDVAAAASGLRRVAQPAM